MRDMDPTIQPCLTKTTFSLTILWDLPLEAGMHCQNYFPIWSVIDNVAMTVSQFGKQEFFFKQRSYIC